MDRPGHEPGLPGGRPGINCLNHGTAKMDSKEVGLEDVNWIYLVQDRYRWRTVLNMVMILGVS